MPLRPTFAVAAWTLCGLAALVCARPTAAAEVIHRPVRPSAAEPADGGTAQGPLGYSPLHMDRSVDPRQDFYRYANGQWLRQLRIPDAEPEVGGFSMLANQLDAQLRQLAVQASQGHAPQGSPSQQVGDFYRAAMNLAQRNEAGLQPLQGDLAAALRASSPSELAQLSLRLQARTGNSPLLSWATLPDLKDSRRVRLNLQLGALSLSKDQYSDPASQPVRDLYLAYIARVHQQLGDAPEVAAAKARTILALETELAAPRLTPLQLYEPARIYNLLSVDEAQALIPAIDLRALAAAARLTLPERLQVQDLAGLRALQQQLATRPAAEVQAFLHWSVLALNMDALGQPWWQLSQDYQRQRDGLAAPPPLERQVVQALSQQLYHPLSQLYVQHFYTEATRRDITRMVGHIKAELARRLKTNPWLDAPTRAAALAKLAQVDIQVGYPQRWIDFSAVAIRPDDHLGNLQRLAAFRLQREVDRLGRPADRERFAEVGHTTPISVNAAYDPQLNGIDITAAISQPPFFTPGADPVVNYCTMGAVVGHELTHGFDSMGRQFDAQGNVRDWWTPRASAEFKQRNDVLVAQFNRLELLPGLHQNGALTLGENTADLGGLTLAHAALHRALKGRHLPRVDGLSTDQRCFVAWSQLWIYKAREERIRLLAAVDYHANSALRGWAPLLNLGAFHRAFGTRPGDAMWRAPADRVRIW
ncbi:M13 family metallopeptidase [Curvibacter sp. HBC61]|uniref:M13 family metallopeptidase n=1 Tax=Curvibacter cyanobacteriorum TaxID=3026422 RepID=A0ABT5N183_9BURK|nr:M13 family metallopeptidase [Curvibacter sp. HBC61]MDD0840078.1 M13 family metallopeptidase [Curvibacter sp. HBC61]